MFESLGRTIARHPRTTALAWLVVAIVSLALSLGLVGNESLFGRLQTEQPTAGGSDSAEGMEILEEAATGGEQINFLVRGVDLSDLAVTEDVGAALAPVHEELAGIDGVEQVVSAFVLPGGLEHPAAATLVAADQDGFLLSVVLAADLDDDAATATHDAVVERLDAVPADLERIAGLDVDAIASSTTLVADAIVEQVQDDLVTGEVVALPLALILMVLVFGGFLAAAMPLVGAAASIATGLGVLLGFTYLMDIDSYMINVLSVVGLGLSVDYGLLVVSRYREELRAAGEAYPAGTLAGGVPVGTRRRARRRHGPDDVVVTALGRTMATAGRTVVFSALTIALAMAGMVFMNVDLIRALTASAVTIVLLAVLASVTLVPALLALLGRRLERPSALARVPGLRAVVGHLGDVAPQEGVFSQIARFVHRFPWPVLVVTLGVLVLLASPLRSFEMRSSTVEMLPSDSDQREFLSIIAADYPASDSPEVVVVTEATGEAVTALADDLAAVDGVAEVEEPTPAGEHTVVRVHLTTDDPGSPEAAAAVADLRAVDADARVWVTGQAPLQKDFNDALVAGMPWVALFVALAVMALLYLMTGSVLIPVKALLTNALSLAASMGITVWVFIEGHLADVVGFEPVAGLEATVVPLILTFGFGLAMDYEVFLLTRIREFWDAGYDNDVAVEKGLQLMGRIITSAAAIIIAVFAGFAAGDLLVIKQVGLALAVTVLIDATIVRLFLVPATMTLLGRWNWWAPAPLRRLHDRLALAH